MCEYFSCIVTREGKVLWCEDNSHEETIKRANLKDDKLKDRDFVRIEVKNGDMKNYCVDEESTLPSWYKLSEKFFKTKTAKILKRLNLVIEDYEKKRAPLYEEYEKKRAPLYEDYNKKRATLYRDYEKKCDALYGDYKKKYAPLYEDYKKKYAPLYEDYKKKLKSIEGYIPEKEGD